MKTLIFVLSFLSASAFAEAGPACKALMLDSQNTPVAKKEWKETVFIGIIEGDGIGIRISTSLGDNQIISLWIREKREPYPNGAFSFVDLSSGREQKNALYLANGYHIEVTCRWENN